MPSALSSFPARVTLLALFSATTFYFLYKSRRLRHLKTLTLSSKHTTRGKILFVSQTGTSKNLAQRLHNLLASNGVVFDLVDAQSYEPEDLPKETIVLIVASTWEDGNPPSGARFFATWLAESVKDFRVGALLLKGCRFGVFGVGSRAYGERFNAVAKGFVKQIRDLGGSEVVPLGEGDVDGGELDLDFEKWCEKVVGFLKGKVLENGANGNLECGVYDSEEESEGESDLEEEEIVDLEDIAGKVPPRKKTAAQLRVMLQLVLL
ncbi:hypothetical protein Ahy_A03g010132 isoform B [Arachis hypogaea]|uniref:Flavodoxin-like domain-containing protein n=1 Tax=Arachis hypogaea TaxID=3818 RepID=A0A445DLA9_ARAHY|nr:hypothetical protein Ahy_A03g010132 isoform A [Arachis hypogaea]RYR63959.1 hypothetical protein Ahy_A03g010132 isoform B [Arachis hypogaea]